MFSKTPLERLVSDFSNIYNKCQSVYELVTSRRYKETIATLTTAEVYSLAEKAYLRCDTNPDLQSPEIENFFAAFEQFYFELKTILFSSGDSNDFASLEARLKEVNKAYQELVAKSNLF